MNTQEISFSGQSRLDCMMPWNHKSDDFENEPLLFTRDRRIQSVYELGGEQFSVLIEVDSTPSAALPEYMVRLLVDRLTNYFRSLRPRRLMRGELVLEEHHDGVVSHLTESSITVRYGYGDEEFEVDYPISQFEDGATLKRGDKIEAVIGLLREPRQTVEFDDLLSEEEQRILEDNWQKRKGVVGDLVL